MLLAMLSACRSDGGNGPEPFPDLLQIAVVWSEISALNAGRIGAKRASFSMEALRGPVTKADWSHLGFGTVAIVNQDIYENHLNEAVFLVHRVLNHDSDSEVAFLSVGGIFLADQQKNISDQSLRQFYSALHSGASAVLAVSAGLDDIPINLTAITEEVGELLQGLLMFDDQTFEYMGFAFYCEASISRLNVRNVFLPICHIVRSDEAAEVRRFTDHLSAV